jgi:predicted DNA-binding transcriptional regulator YafY
MRADRLLSILMYLQTRGRTTTDRLAREFEVSRRTIIRDLYALRVAGFPVYTERGCHGGCYLHDEYRATLTQLTTDEVAALFLSSIHEPLRALGLSDVLRGAQLKLTAAIPKARQAAKSRVAERILIEPIPRGRQPESGDLLPVLHRAVMEDRRVHVRFARPYDVMTERTIEPHGLVASDGTWFLVWIGNDGRPRVDRLSTIRAATMREDRFDRVGDLDLEAFWTAWLGQRNAVRRGFEVRLRVREDALSFVRDALGRGRGIFPDTAKVGADWVEIDASFHFLEEARRAVLAFGGAVEVIRPESLRRSVADYAEQIRRVYSTPSDPRGC